MANAMPHVPKGSQQVENDVESHHWPLRRRNTDPMNLSRPRIFEVRRKNRELMGITKSGKNDQIALPDRIVRRHDIVEQRYFHGAVSRTPGYSQSGPAVQRRRTRARVISQPPIPCSPPSGA